MIVREMNESEDKVVLSVNGMTCTNCEKHIERDLKEVQGINQVQVSFLKGDALVFYDAQKVTIEQILKTIEEAGYSATTKQAKKGFTYAKLNQILLGIVVILGGYLLIKRTGLLNIINLFPQANEDTGYELLFFIGFMSSFHCLAMCGGINLSQSMGHGREDQSRWGTIKPSFLYNLGRVVSYTIFGGIVGAVGSIVSFTGRLQGVVQLLAGIFMVIMGITMLGQLPWLRRFNVRMPKQLRRSLLKNKGRKRPFYVGLANGLMPCGPLQAMQLYALATGSILKGAFAMFLFSLGTVPLMFLLGVFSSILSKKFAGKVMKFGAVLVVILGISMANNGLNLAGVVTPYGTVKEAIKAQRLQNVQEVTIQLESGSYTPIIVEKGTKVRWIIEARKGSLNGCNDKIIAHEFGIEQKLKTGENVVEFTPMKTGTFAYSCWMGMIHSKIYVVEPGE